MYTYYNIHTHHTRAEKECLSIINLHQQFGDSDVLSKYSIGLHPWYPDTFDSDWEALKQMATHSSVLAIGECGLDKVCDTDWQLQTTIFRQQIQLAENIHKPLIIHCVRAYEEVVAMLKEHNITVAVIFHGFNKKRQLAEQLIKHGYYLSFGAALMYENSIVKDVFRSIPDDRYFLETDNSDIPIADLYLQAAAIRKTNVNSVKEQIHKNFKKVFKL